MPRSTLLIFSSNALEHHAVIKKVTARERYVHKNEGYILGELKGEGHNFQVILREPVKHTCSMAMATKQAIQLFHPQFAFLLGFGEGVGSILPGDVVVANRVLAQMPVAETNIKAPQWLGQYPGALPYFLQDLKSLEECVNMDDTLPHTAILEGSLVSHADLISFTNHTANRKVFAVAPEAEGFFKALQSTPEVCGMSLMGINHSQGQMNEHAPSNHRAAENLASASLALWRLINAQEFLAQETEIEQMALSIVSEVC